MIHSKKYKTLCRFATRCIFIFHRNIILCAYYRLKIALLSMTIKQSSSRKVLALTVEGFHIRIVRIVVAYTKVHRYIFHISYRDLPAIIKISNSIPESMVLG